MPCSQRAISITRYTSLFSHQITQTCRLTPSLRPCQDDWRIWKTCGVFEGQTLTHTLVSNPAQPANVDYYFAQASGDASAACFYETKGSKDVILATGGTFQKLSNNVVGASRAYAHCDISKTGDVVVFEQKDINGTYRIYRRPTEGGPAVIIGPKTEKAGINPDPNPNPNPHPNPNPNPNPNPDPNPDPNPNPKRLAAYLFRWRSHGVHVGAEDL